MHDPVVLFHESGIIDFLAVGNGFNKRFEIVPLMKKRLRRHVAASPGTSFAWSTCRRDKLLVKVFSGPSLCLFREPEQGRHPDPRQLVLFHSLHLPPKTL